VDMAMLFQNYKEDISFSYWK